MKRLPTTLRRRIPIVLTALVAFLGVSATAALADIPPQIGVGTTVGGGTGGNHTPPPSGGGGGGGGSVSGSPADPGTHWVTIVTVIPTSAYRPRPAPLTPSAFVNLGGYTSMQCNAQSIAGDPDWYATSASGTFSVYDDPNQVNPATGRHYQTAVNLACHYPPQPTDTPILCAKGGAGTVVEDHPARRTVGFIPFTPSAWTLDPTNPAKCNDPLTVAVQATMDAPGAYLASVTGQQQECMLRSYNDGRPDKIVQCGAAYTSTREIKGAVWCTSDGNNPVAYAFGDDSWNHDFSAGACSRSANSRIGCAVNGTILLSGLMNPADHDGGMANLNPIPDGSFSMVTRRGADTHTVVFPKTTFGADVVAVTGLRTMIAVPVKTATGFRTDLDLNAAGQSLVHPDGPLNSFLPTDQTNVRFGWFDTSLAYNPHPTEFARGAFAVSKQVSFDALVKITTVRIDAIDVLSGQVQATPVVATTHLTGLGCSSYVANIQVNRGRTVN